MAEAWESNAAGGRLTGAESAELSGQLANLTSAGLPLGSSLAALADEMPNGRLRRAMKELARMLESGVTLSEAVEGQKRRIPAHLRGLVLAGLRAGRLGDVLGEFSGYLNVGADLKRRLWLNLAYPVLSMAIAATLFAFVSVLLVPQFEGIFRDFGIPLPGATIAVLEIASGVRAILPTLALLMVGLFLLWGAGPILLPPGTMRSLAARVPIVGRVWRWTSLAEFCHLLGLLVENRLPLSESLRLTGEGVVDSDVTVTCQKMARDVESGRDLAQAMSRCWLFPAELPRLVSWSEQQGSLPEVLHMAGEMFAARASAHSTFAGALIGVLAVLLILWGMFTVVAGLMLPLIILMNKLS
jgi:type II secretory pathway component PulF